MGHIIDNKIHFKCIDCDHDDHGHDHEKETSEKILKKNNLPPLKHPDSLESKIILSDDSPEERPKIIPSDDSPDNFINKIR